MRRLNQVLVTASIFLSACSGPEKTNQSIESAPVPSAPLIHTTCPVSLSEAGESETGVLAQFSGMCPLNKVRSLSVSFDMDKRLHQDATSFTATDTSFETYDLSNFFVYDPTENKFYVPIDAVPKMWGGLDKGSYVFTVNPISDDWDFAAVYEFEFEIR